MNEIDLYSQPSYSDTVKLYHVTENSNDSRLVKFRFRDKPTDTPVFIHNLVNHYSVKKFGLPVRNLFFTYAERMFKTQMRVIPLGNNVRYFYNPDVDDMTALFVIEVYKKVEEFIWDIKDQYNYNYDIDEMASIFRIVIEEGKNLKEVLDTMSKRYSALVENSEDLAKTVLAFFIKHIKEYVDGIIEVDDVEGIPLDTGAEIMVYAPDDLYLISTQ